MRGSIANRFLFNYAIMFIISIIITFITLLVLDFANHMIMNTLVKSNYTADSLMQDDYEKIDLAPVIDNGGGVQVIDQSYEIVLTAGLNTFKTDTLTVEQFTDFLTSSKSKGIPFNYDIAYNPNKRFWLVVTFPTSLRIDFQIVSNKEYTSVDTQNVVTVLVSVVMFYLILLAGSTFIYSKLTSISFVNPLKQFYKSAKRLRDGDYTARVELRTKNEFGELAGIFNAMAERIEEEMSLRKQSEENRKKLVLDVSHDLKNPLASVMGYAELLRNNGTMTKENFESYINIIYENSVRANSLIVDMFELSKMDSPEFQLIKEEVDVCEYVRQRMISAIPSFDEAGFTYDFDIPDVEIYSKLDTRQMNRVFQNLVSNAIQYNHAGTNVSIKVKTQNDVVFITFSDNGVGIPAEHAETIFQPFARVDRARNSETGGTGLGLAIVDKIITAHGGRIELITTEHAGCEFIIQLPKAEPS
ncbi:sensor histidine kinase [Bacillus sp. HMF5848]|uniref:sensor histidine kinase n=1 Tax=Bacillus sp. HMF5848 TaxID=2495421 RepID=UPI000F792EC7|nr:HAMP domain-containing sensor histidine kinase [Bacillus sp. HMF5848]RSK25929.1 sensor histidine kinase [Bacillus sp. HMF5848]